MRIAKQLLSERQSPQRDLAGHPGVPTIGEQAGQIVGMDPDLLRDALDAEILVEKAPLNERQSLGHVSSPGIAEWRRPVMLGSHVVSPPLEFEVTGELGWRDPDPDVNREHRDARGNDRQRCLSCVPGARASGSDGLGSLVTKFQR